MLHAWPALCWAPSNSDTLIYAHTQSTHIVQCCAAHTQTGTYIFVGTVIDITHTLAVCLELKLLT